MAVTTLHDLSKEKQVFTHSASVATSPAVAVMQIPFQGKILKVGVTVAAAFTGTLSVAVNLISYPADGSQPGAGTAISGSPFTLVGAGSAAGTSNSLVPGADTYANEGDVLSFTCSGATGAAVPGSFYAVVRRGL